MENLGTGGGDVADYVISLQNDESCCEADAELFKNQCHLKLHTQARTFARIPTHS